MIISDDELQECFSLLNAAMRPTLGARADILRRIEKRVQELQVSAWDQGYSDAFDNMKPLAPYTIDNPYRVEVTS